MAKPSKRVLVRKAAKGRAAEYYEPHESDPLALRRKCPVCPAAIGSWCGGFGDVHDERHTKAELQKVLTARRVTRAREDQIEQALTLSMRQGR
jgi:hypothetical protein